MDKPSVSQAVELMLAEANDLSELGRIVGECELLGTTDTVSIDWEAPGARADLVNFMFTQVMSLRNAVRLIANEVAGITGDSDGD